MNNPPKILFFLRRIGPYHHARFQTAADKLQLVTVETRPGSQEYPWDFDASGKYQAERIDGRNDPEHGVRGSVLNPILEEVFNRHKPDAVVTTGWADPEYHSVILAASKAAVPCILISDSRYEDEPRKYYKEWVKRRILRAYSSALVAGTASRDYLIRLGFNSAAIFKPWDVVDNEHFANAFEIRKGVDFLERDFVCVSRFLARKNISNLLHAFAEYAKAGGHRRLLLLGSGELENALRKEVTQLGLEKVVLFEGFIQYEELPHYFGRSFSLVLPSTIDTWGLVVNEAMASGLPVLVSRLCGSSLDLVQHGKNGYTFDPFSKREILEAIQQMDLVDEVQWNQMSDVSKAIISVWGVSAFATGLMEACAFSLAARKRSISKPLHLILSR